MTLQFEIVEEYIGHLSKGPVPRRQGQDLRSIWHPNWKLESHSWLTVFYISAKLTGIYIGEGRH